MGARQLADDGGVGDEIVEADCAGWLREREQFGGGGRFVGVAGGGSTAAAGVGVTDCAAA